MSSNHVSITLIITMFKMAALVRISSTVLFVWNYELVGSGCCKLHTYCSVHGRQQRIVLEYEVSMAENTYFDTVLCDVTPCSLVNKCNRFRGIWCPHLQVEMYVTSAR
jgi:hypothetical protein